MKKGIHPTWHANCTITCACGNSFVTGSTLSSLQVDICSACHPFFTGEMKFVDTQGRVDRFMQKMQAAQSAQQTKRSKKAQQATEDAGPAKTYKQLLQEQKTTLKSPKAAPAADDAVVPAASEEATASIQAAA